MKTQNIKLLEDLIAAPSISGFEQPGMRIVRDFLKPYTDSIKTDVHGNVIGVINPQAKLRVMLAGHCDQIGFMVRYITDEGFIYFSAVGGIEDSVVPGTKVWIHAGKKAIPGIIGKKAIHLLKPEERKKVTQLNKLFVDIGATSKKDAAKLVSIGDPITFDSRLLKLKNNQVSGPGMDDKAGVFIMCETLRLLAASKKRPQVAVYGVATVQEELGLRGARTSAFEIDPHVGIAIDVDHATDYPGNEKAEVGDVSLGKGPIISRGPNINPIVYDLLIKAAQKKKIPHQVEGAPSATGTDANAIQINKSGVAAGLVGIPNRYMHTQVEMVSIDDLANSAKLLAEFILSLTPKTNFIPL
ncbi:MAG: M42 family metallopeptidase [Deltaproteobacteria bacterium]|nr:M42 family metallopeptidase [Deltaproteobacteria bacterium]